MWWERPARQEDEQQQQEAPKKSDSPLPWWEQPVNDEDRAWSPGSPVFKKDVMDNLERGDCDDENAEWWKKWDTRADPTRITLNKIRQARFATPWWSSPQDLGESEIPGAPGVPPPPPPPPGAPPPPPMPGMPKKPMSTARKQMLDGIRKASRTRPDWNCLLRNIESGAKLRHLTPFEKTDRSEPMLPSSRGKGGKFVYDSEKPLAHNELLYEIHRGVRLRKTRTNDRSKPDFKALGLRRLRRQVTQEEKEKPEQIQISSDEEEDIDKMRDDLQATKGQLEDEIKKRSKIERESKILKIDVEGLQMELKKLKRQLKMAQINEPKPMVNGEADEIVPKLEKSMSKLRMREDENLDFSELDSVETEINNLKTQAESYKKQADDYLDKYDEITQKLIVSENSAAEWELRGTYYEKKYKALQKEQCIELPDIETVGTQTDPVDFTPLSPSEDGELKPFPLHTKSGSSRSFASSFIKMQSFMEEEEDEEEEEKESEEEEETEEDEEDIEEEESVEGENEEQAAERRANNEGKRKERDIKLWKTKLEHMKDREITVHKERDNLRNRIRQYFRDLKTEREAYLKAKDEVDEMATQLKDTDDDEDEESEETEEEEEEEVPEENEEDGEWWLDKFKLKPIKLKKKKKKKVVNDDGEEEDKDEENEGTMYDLSALEDPVWSDSEHEDSEDDDEKAEFDDRVNKLQERTKEHELRMNNIKKNNYLLKTQVERCDDMYAIEKRRRKRLDEELHIMLSEIS